jgi:terminase large subunit-like protein
MMTVRKKYKPRKSLRDEGVTKIIGEGIGTESIRITVHHRKGDGKNPITTEILKDWYGDVRIRFRADAEQYFSTYVALDLEREIGSIYLDMVKAIIEEQEKKSKEEVALRLKQVAAARESPSFEREYNLKYIGLQGNVFSERSIQKATEIGTLLEEQRKGSIPPHTIKSMGVDPGWSSSKFGIVVTQLKTPEGIAEVLYSEEFDKPDYTYMLDVIKKIRSNFDVKMVFIDDMNPEVVRSLKAVYNELTDYKKEIDRLRSKKLNLYEWMQIVPVSFRLEHREMLSHIKMLLDSRALAIDPNSHSKLIVALRTAYAVDGDLKKDVTSHNDLLDALQLSCKYWNVGGLNQK